MCYDCDAGVPVLGCSIGTTGVEFLEKFKAKNICGNKQITILQFQFVIYKLAAEIMARCCHHAPTLIPLLHSTEKFPRSCFLFVSNMYSTMFVQKKKVASN